MRDSTRHMVNNCTRWHLRILRKFMNILEYLILAFLSLTLPRVSSGPDGSVRDDHPGDV